jgi:hypothetical protein
VPVHGADVEAVREGDAVLIPIRGVCNALGLSFARQLAKLKAKPWATVAFKATVGADRKPREVACVDLRSLPMWLATIEPGRVKEPLRERLAAYQRDAAEVLARHFFGERGAVSVDTVAAPPAPSAPPRALPAPAPLLPLADALLAQLAADVDTLATVASICVGSLPPEMVEPTRAGLSVAEGFLKRAERAHEDRERLQVASATHAALAARLAEMAPPSASLAAVSITATAIRSIDEATTVLHRLCTEILLREPEGSMAAKYADYLCRYMRVGQAWKQKGGVN